MLIRRARKRTLHFLSWVIILSGIGLFITGAIITWRQSQQHDPPPSTKSRQQISNSSPDSPPSTEKPKPSEFDSYTVAPDHPRYLFIPTLSIKAMIKPIGLTKDNRIDVPKNAFDVGWYTPSAKPGQSGVLVIDGHVSGGAVPGIFYNLNSLQIGDTTTLERGDGTQYIYRIVKKQEYSVNNVDMTAVLTPISNRPGLNLITCTGNVIKGTNNYDKRLVVFTEQL
jgi:sortase (surface protein transpeptidase)